MLWVRTFPSEWHVWQWLGILLAHAPLHTIASIRRNGAPGSIHQKAQAVGLTLEETKQILDLKARGRAPCRKVAELCEKHLQEIDARLAQLRAYQHALRESVNIWRKENAPERECAGEFCDLIERLP